MKRIFKATTIAVISFYLVFFIPTALAQVDTTTTGNNVITPGVGNNVTTGNNVITPGVGNNTTTGNNVITPGVGNNTTTGNNVLTPGVGNNTTNDNNYNNTTGTLNNTTNDVVNDDNEVGDIIVYGAGGAVLGGLLTYFAVRGNKRTI